MDVRELCSRPARNRRQRRAHCRSQYMRKYGAFEVTREVYKQNEKPVAAADLAGSKVEAERRRHQGRQAGGRDGRRQGGRRDTTRLRASWNCFRKPWPTGSGPSSRCPSTTAATSTARRRRLRWDNRQKILTRSTRRSSKWPKDARGEVYTLLPIFRLPNLIHTRSGNAKFLYEISHKNPLWVNPVDAGKLGGVRTGDLLKVHTEIGYFVLHAWVTEGLTPGVVACSHHLGRWRD